MSIPSGFKNREEYNEYMRKYNREYRKRKKEEFQRLHAELERYKQLFGKID